VADIQKVVVMDVAIVSAINVDTQIIYIRTFSYVDMDNVMIVYVIGMEVSDTCPEIVLMVGLELKLDLLLFLIMNVVCSSGQGVRI
jgi:hypothetical protein